MDKKKEIIKCLKQFKRLSLTRIAGITGMSAKYTRKYLDELIKQNKIIETKETVATYFALSK